MSRTRDRCGKSERRQREDREEYEGRLVWWCDARESPYEKRANVNRTRLDPLRLTDIRYSLAEPRYDEKELNTAHADVREIR